MLSPRPDRFVPDGRLRYQACRTMSAVLLAATPSIAQSPLNERAEAVDPRAARIGRHVANIELGYLDGTRGQLSELVGPKGLLIFVRGAECPVSKRYGNETARIEREYAPRGLGVLFVDMEDPGSPEAVREEIATFGFQGRYALDPEQRLGAELGATRTTEVFLLDSARTLVYRGAIDDQYGRGYSLAEPRRRFVRQALEALLSGEQPLVDATSAPGCLLAPRTSAAPVEDSAPTYQREISRLLQQNCVECHRKGGVAPFALDSYESARRKGGTILDVVERGIMPPWFAKPDTGPWVRERRLSQEERLLLRRWFDAGAPEGDPADAPLPRRWKEGWQIGEPDYVMSMPEAFHVPAEGQIQLQEFVVEESFPEDMWVERIQILPQATQVVHHVVVMIEYPGKNPVYFFGYLPGGDPLVYEKGLARFVPKGSLLRFTMHYTPNGVTASDRTSMGFVRAKNPPDHIAIMRMLKNEEIFIPAGADNVTFSDSCVMPGKARIRSLTPHMHLRGKTFRLDATLPDGTRRELLDLTGWDANWQFTYVFRDWPLVPAGTVLRATATYDNSAANEDNPDPTVDVVRGPMTTDEMMMFAVECVARNRKGR